MRYFLYLAYHGAAYSGWQIQQNSPSVQQTVQTWLSHLLAEPISIVGSSRTDKGVHAEAQVAHFDTAQSIEPTTLSYRLNRVLPHDISIHMISPVVGSAHARFDASYRHYSYTISQQKNPFYSDRAIWLQRTPPLARLNQLAALFCGQRDFEFFSKTNKQMHGFLCTIHEAYWIQKEHLIIFHIKANRFLRGMVRVLVNRMLQIANGKIDIEHLMQELHTKPPTRPTLTLAAPQGLNLVEVGYPKRIFL